MSVSSLSIVPACFLGLLFTVFVGTFSGAKERANIVLIMADDMGYECLRANGGTDYRTPNLDELAGQGVRFTRAHATPICTPSRVQIMSGLYNSRNYTEFGHMDPQITTFGNRLQDAGYATCVVGKWQLQGGYGSPQVGGFKGPHNFGFEEYCLWQVTRTSKRKPNRYANPGLEINGREVDFREGQYGPDIVSNYACDFIERQAEADKPFLLYYPMILPHWPFEPTPDTETWDPTYRRDDDSEKLNRGQWTKENFVAMVAYADKIVGLLLQTLEDNGVRDNTLVIFVGDNGTDQSITSTFHGKPYRGGKGRTTLNGTRVPMIVDWPGEVAAATVCPDLIDFTDLMPTLLEAARVPVPEDFVPDGRSFLPQVRGEEGKPREWIYCFYEPKKKEFAMTQRYKLYKSGLYYDLAQDLAEKSAIEPDDRNDEQKQVAAKLRKVIEKHTR